MIRIFFFTLSMLIACDELIAQTKEAGPHFEVASIKASDEGNQYWPTGGPGTKEPTNFSAHTYLGILLRQAFNLQDAPGQEDLPAWVWRKPIFLLTARVSPDATKEQIPLMLQALLKDRFHLAYHFEKREVAGYRMVIAKNGLKIKRSADDSEAAELTPATKIDKDGFPNGQGTWGIGGNPVKKYYMKNQTMGQIAAFVGHHFGPDPDKPVVDATGLTGKYDITLYWQAGALATTADSDNVPETPGSGQPMLVAVQSQLGLKLEPAKLLLNVFVLDHMDKIPTEN